MGWLEDEEAQHEGFSGEADKTTKTYEKAMKKADKDRRAAAKKRAKDKKPAAEKGSKK